MYCVCRCFKNDASSEHFCLWHLLHRSCWLVLVSFLNVTPKCLIIFLNPREGGKVSKSAFMSPFIDSKIPDIWYLSASYACVLMWRRLVWMLNISKHIMASNKTLPSSSLITPFSIFLPAPLALRPLTSPSTRAPRFHFPSPRLHFLSLFDPPPLCMHMSDDSTRMYTHKTYAWMKMINSRDVYCTWTDPLVEPSHTHTLCIFSDWSYGSPRGLKWKPIKSDIFHFHLHIVTARRELQC